LKRVAIVEMWWNSKIKKEMNQSKKLQKQVRPGEVDEGNMEELQKMRTREILASQRLNEREA